MYNNKTWVSRLNNSYWEIQPTQGDYPKVHLLIFTPKVWERFCFAHTYGPPDGERIEIPGVSGYTHVTYDLGWLEDEIPDYSDPDIDEI